MAHDIKIWPLHQINVLIPQTTSKIPCREVALTLQNIVAKTTQDSCHVWQKTQTIHDDKLLTSGISYVLKDDLSNSRLNTG